jgi:hypothetical protein
MLTIALSHLLGRGLRLETHEAVALARELLAHPCGVPTPGNIQLGSDGTASCISTNGAPSVASVADLLQTLLPAGNPNVPAPLRYAIARGLEAVEAPPFASLDEFSSALERFEKGEGRSVLRGVLQRGARPSRPIAAPIAVAPPRVTPLAEGPAPVAPPPALVSARPTLVVRRPVASFSETPQPIAAAPPMFRSFGADREADVPVRSSAWWALAAVAALVVSFAVGFAVADGITDRAAPKPSGSAHMPPRFTAVAPAANDSAANAPTVETKDEILRALRTTAVAHQIVPPPAAAGTDGPGGRADRVVAPDGTERPSGDLYRSDRTRARMKAASKLWRWVFLAPLGYMKAPRAMGKSPTPDP